MGRRVVVTGLGPVSGIGVGVAAFAEALRLGKSGTGPIASFDTTGFQRTYAGEVPDFDAGRILRGTEPDRWGRSARFAAAAARLAVDDAGIDASGDRTAVIVGTTSGEIVSVVDMAEGWHTTGWAPPSADLAARVPASSLALAAADEIGATGETLTLATACSAGNYALGYAYDLISTGETDVAVAGGADSVARFTHAGFHRLGALAETACSPFDRDRQGILTAEGGVALVLEDRATALARGARIHAEVLGYAMTCDAKHPVAPDAESIARCARLAHERAGISAADVDYICAHGTGTPTNDQVETAAMSAVFGTLPPMSSIKSMLGHTMGAASGFGALACVLAITGGFLPPTVNHRTADPGLPGVDPVPNASRPMEVRVAQNNGFAFGGNNAIMLLGRHDPAGPRSGEGTGGAA